MRANFVQDATAKIEGLLEVSLKIVRGRSSNSPIVLQAEAGQIVEIFAESRLCKRRRR